MSRLYVVARDRSAIVDGNLTLKEVAELLNSRGQVFSLRRTFQLYGLTFISERQFTTHYGEAFNLSVEKCVWDIKLRELDLYKQLLFKQPFKIRW